MVGFYRAALQCRYPKYSLKITRFVAFWIWIDILKTSTKFVHSCVIQTKSNRFKQSLTKSNKAV